VQVRSAAIIERVGPVLAIVAAALLVILGILIIIYPAILAWVVGIGLILAGVAVLASVLTGTGRILR
jgi:hypothetical protein